MGLVHADLAVAPSVPFVGIGGVGFGVRRHRLGRFCIARSGIGRFCGWSRCSRGGFYVFNLRGRKVGVIKAPSYIHRLRLFHHRFRYSRGRSGDGGVGRPSDNIDGWSSLRLFRGGRVHQAIGFIEKISRFSSVRAFDVESFKSFQFTKPVGVPLHLHRAEAREKVVNLALVAEDGEFAIGDGMVEGVVVEGEIVNPALEVGDTVHSELGLAKDFHDVGEVRHWWGCPLGYAVSLPWPGRLCGDLGRKERPVRLGEIYSSVLTG
jgi:hypothetical protein